MANILVVDDRAINRDFLAALLGDSGHAVAEAGDGLEALASVAWQTPDLVIADLVMPRMDGLELARRLREAPDTRAIPILIYTATYRLAEARERAGAAGVDAVLPKPSDPLVILGEVDRLLDDAATARESKASDEPPGIAWLERLQREPFARATKPRTVAKDTHALSLRLAALLELGLALGSERNRHRLLAQFCQSASNLLRARHVAVVIADPGSMRVVDWSGIGLDEDTLRALPSLDLSRGPFGEALRTQAPVSIALLGEDLDALGIPASFPRTDNLLVVPLHSSVATGAAYFASTLDGRPFDEEDEQIATTLAAQLVSSYATLALLDDLHTQADALRDSEARYRRLFDATPLPMWVYDVESLRFVAVNAAAMETYGYSRDEFLAMTILDIRPREDRATFIERLRTQELFDPGNVWRHRYKDGRLVVVEISSHDIDLDGRASRLVAVNDITRRIEQEQRISRLNRVRAVMGEVSSAMLRIRDRRELLAEACRIAANEGVFPFVWATGRDPASGLMEIVASAGSAAGGGVVRTLAAMGRIPPAQRPSMRAIEARCSIVVNDLRDYPVPADVVDAIEADGFRSGGAFPLFVDGEPVAVLGFFASERGFFDDQEIALLEWMARDLSYALEHIASSDRLDRLAYFDALTGLPNMRLFKDRLEQSVISARDARGRVGVVVFDLVEFTHVNQTLGRDAGDDLLRAIGARLSRFLTEPYTLGRIGADTFAIASPREPALVSMHAVDRLFQSLAEPFELGTERVQIDAQAGVAIFPDDGADGREIFRNAEGALKLARSGGQRHMYYSSEVAARLAARRVLEKELDAALERGEFVLHYQGRIDLANGHLVGAEALLRWQHPTKGLLPPGDFVGLAEEGSIIVGIGAWAIEEVCRQQAAWAAEGIGIVPVAVNLSARQLEHDPLVHTVRESLARHGVDARLLDLELTESAVMKDPDSAARVLAALRTVGVRLALDDFGTGYSSLAHLRRLPFDSVKIDRSFVAEVTTNAGDAAIATAIVAMAHRLGLKVIAEGVETEAQMRFLRAQDCDEMQGYYFSPAVAADAFAGQLRSSRRIAVADEKHERPLLLVADADEGTRAAITRLLRRDGYEILGAASGEEALEILACRPVQVLISGQRMESGRGSDFLETVKQLHPPVVRIVLSGYTDLDAVISAINRGAAFRFLTKPWDDERLREAVRDAFRHAAGSA